MGFFNPYAGAGNETACERCPPRSTTLGDASTSKDSCVCDPGLYYSPDSKVCVPCPFGVRCPSIGTTVETLHIERGYYRLSNASTDVRRCPDAAVNCSDAPECLESTSGCRGGTSGTTAIARRRLEGGLLPPGPEESLELISGCSASLTGVFCQLCVPRSDGTRVYYSAATSRQVARCEECNHAARDNILRVFGILVALAVGAVALFATFRFMPSRHREQLRNAWLVFTPHVKLKIMMGFYLIATKIDNVYEVELPPEVKRLLSAFSFAVSFGFGGINSVLECLGMRGYVPLLGMYMVTPGVIAVLILLVGAAHTLCRSSRSSHSSQAEKSTRAVSLRLLASTAPYLLQLFFVAYPLVTTVAFDAFSCHHFEESEWLKADVSIQCGTAAHDDASTLAWVAIVLYPVGLLVVNGALLFAARRAIMSKKPTALSCAIAFLHREYGAHEGPERRAAAQCEPSPSPVLAIKSDDRRTLPQSRISSGGS